MVNIKIEALKPGQEVGLANCVTLGRVVARVRKNLYSVDWNGHRLEIPRNQLLIKRGNVYVRY